MERYLTNNFNPPVSATLNGYLETGGFEAAKKAILEMTPAEVTEEVIKQMRAAFDHDTIVTVARYSADYLAEESGLLSLVAYYDDKEDSGLIQFRIRRSHSFKTLDLRSILEVFNIKNGGGHPGAIGFRVPAEEIPDLQKYVEFLVKGIEKMILEAAG